MTRTWRAAPWLATLAVSACASGPPQPVPLDPKGEACASCRMAVSDGRFAAQLVAPGEVPRFFDDLGCLAAFLNARMAPAGAVAFVADHRTKEWIRADRAVYLRVAGLETPMGSKLLAYADATSRDQDASARTGVPVAVTELFSPKGPPIGEAR